MSTAPSSKLTIYHDGRFWIGLCETADEEGYRACRVVFGAEPADEDISHFVNGPWNDLRFSRAQPADPVTTARNPKRRQREARKAMQAPATSTKSQAALSAQHEEMKEKREALSKEHREAVRQRRFELSRQKRKRKHRGR